MHFTELATPVLLLDIDRYQRNTSRLRERLNMMHVRLTPHAKTLKSIDALHAAGFTQKDPLCVSTLREAEYFFEGGWSDITYTSALDTSRFERLANLISATKTVRVVVADVNVVRALSHFAAARNIEFRVYVEIDCGAHRTGVSEDDPALLEMAREVSACPQLYLQGVFTWAGHSYSAKSIVEIKQIATLERETAMSAQRRLVQDGIAPGEVSLGTTPTALFGDSFVGVTDVRAGVYSLFDEFQAELGCCSRSDIAVSVLTTVLQSNPQRAEVIVDAGFLALSSDDGHGRDFGKPFRADGAELDGWSVKKLNQEHAFLTGTGGAAGAPARGAKLRISPNHACSTAAAFDAFTVIAGDGTVVGRWPRCHGW